MSTLCMASMPFEGDGLYDGLLGIDMETSTDVLSLQGDASHLVSRQVNETRQLTDNSISPREIVPGDLDFWTFPASQWNSSKTKNNSTLYLTVSACTQPFPRTGLNTTEVYASGSPPALRLYVSTDPSNKQPGPSSDPARQNMTELSYGFANMTLVLPDITKDVYITVASQNISSDWQGTWTYQIGASTQGNAPVP
jgi:Stretch-activated Ca2+-permeable channel component